MFILLVLALCLNLFIPAQAHDTTQTSSIYKKIQPLSMSSLEYEDEDWPNEPFRAYLERCFNYQFLMQEFKKRRTVFQLFDKIASSKFSDSHQLHSSLYDMTTGQDVNLLCGNKKEDPCLIQLIDRTQTQFGKIFLAGLLSTPVVSLKILQQRQDTIKHLVTHDELYCSLKEVFASIAQLENIVLSFWGHDGFLQSSKRCYFSIPFIKSLEEQLNNSETILLFNSLWQHQLRLTQLAITVGATTILPIYTLSLLANIQLPHYVQAIADYFQHSGPYILAAIIALLKDHKSVEIAGSTATSFYTAIFAKENFDWEYDNFILELFLQKKLITITNFFKTLKSLRIALQNNPAFVTQCVAAQQFLETIEVLKTNNDLEQLFKILQTSTFNGNESIISHKGRILVAYRLMHNLKHNFEELFLLLGELEAYLSCATLFREFANQRVSYCFVEYCSSPNPYLEFIDFWNPFIDPSIVVPNSIVLGHDVRRNALITGPNAGGKSALIKGIVLNLILAQSIGLVAANQAIITPFYFIATYLNIVDDIASGNSLFKAQVLRAQEVILAADETPSDQFCFIALDEMFNGTSAKESVAAAYSVANYLGHIKNCMCMIATHFPLLTTLEKETDSFSNYKVSVENNPKEGIHYPFKIQEGTSDQHIALEILKQEGFDSSIITNAAKILNLLL